jgi:hypothetical protein
MAVVLLSGRKVHYYTSQRLARRAQGCKLIAWRTMQRMWAVLPFLFIILPASSTAQEHHEAHPANHLLRFWEPQLLQLSPNKRAVAVVMRSRDLVRFHWMRRLHTLNITVFFVEDDVNQNSLVRIDERAEMYALHVDEAQAASQGFNGLKYIGETRMSAWDKAVYFFCVVVPQYEFVWILEDDVYVPSEKAFEEMNKLANTADLITSEHLVELNASTKEWHWPLIRLSLPTPWYHGMSCAVGLSRASLREVHLYAKRFGALPFLEALFNTVAAHANLAVLTPAALQTILYMRDWTCGEIDAHPLNWFHPIKHQAEFIGECVLNGTWAVTPT